MEKNAKIQQTNRATKRKQLVGVVISTKNHKTIGVNVDNYQKHPLYSKRIKVSKKFNVHDEKEVSKVGDVVRIAETRPLSKTKNFRLVEVIKKEGQ